MPAKSYYLDNAMLNAVLNATTYTSPTSVYVALYTTTPGAGGAGGVEVSGGSYARVTVTAGFSAPSNGSTSNSGTVSFPMASAAWGTVTGVGVFDASSSGNLLYFGALTTSKTVNSGDTVSFAATALAITEQ